MHRELLEAMSAEAENCRRADSISYIHIQQVFQYEGNCGEMGTARRIRELARAFSNEMRHFRARQVANFEIMAGCGMDVYESANERRTYNGDWVWCPNVCRLLMPEVFMRVLYEFLWCLNVSSVVVWAGDESGTSALLGALYRIVFPLLRYFKAGINLRRDHTLILWAMTLLLAIVIFPFLTLLSSFFSVRRFLFPALGVAAAGALPLGFWFGGAVGVLLYNTWEGLLLLLETIAALACVSFYILQVRHWPRFLGPILLILHVAIWGFACHFLVGLVDVFHSSGLVVTFFWWAPLNLVIPILGFASCATWAMYARAAIHESGTQVAKAPALQDRLRLWLPWFRLGCAQSGR